MEIFETRYRVPVSDENAMHHVDNQVYLRWMNEVAITHSTALGWSVEDYVRLGSAFFARNHTMEYLAQTYAGDELLFVTWISSMNKMLCYRQYRFIKLPHYELCLRAETKWAYVHMASEKLIRIPEQVRNSFQPASENKVEARLKELKAG